MVELRELTAEQSAAVLAALREQLAAHHHIEIDDSCIRACTSAAQNLPGHFPAKALLLLDAAAAHASLAQANLIAADDIYFAAQAIARSCPEDPTSDTTSTD